MDKEIDNYLEKFSRGLTQLTEYDKTEIINEIKSHIYEALKRQEPLDTVLNKLGDPAKLARSYNNSYSLESNYFDINNILSNIIFYCSIAFSGMFVVLILPTISFALVLSAIFIMGISITNIIGITNLPFNLGIIQIGGISQIFMAIIISIILCLIARISWIGLKKYLKLVSTNYHKRRVGNIR